MKLNQPLRLWHSFILSIILGSCAYDRGNLVSLYASDWRPENVKECDDPWKNPQLGEYHHVRVTGDFERRSHGQSISLFLRCDLDGRHLIDVASFKAEVASAFDSELYDGHRLRLTGTLSGQKGVSDRYLYRLDEIEAVELMASSLGEMEIEH